MKKISGPMMLPVRAKPAPIAARRRWSATATRSTRCAALKSKNPVFRGNHRRMHARTHVELAQYVLDMDFDGRFGDAVQCPDGSIFRWDNVRWFIFSIASSRR